MDTVNVMNDKRRKFLEDELVRIATELGQHTRSASFIVPYTRKDSVGSGVMRYVAVGTHNSIHALMQRTLAADQAHKLITKGKKK